ncbi:E2 protein [Bos taurus papillomavirus 20]|uniref:Regulatory protein E2 n=1 Tax=Bos taurus papillomavirus 20 TaxID=1887218 RepID=A0A1B2K213_9PAPI|nr:E2 protein [Bos taurus papillomavirus 20]ANZ90260.1 E2 protein [Bos taurus papillomavirus 20]
MEELAARFDAVQERLMQIYESGSVTLESQIEYWTVVRKEYALYYTARKQGIKKLGLYVVPSLQIAEQKAKEAIRMTLYLESLSKSQFGDLQWTLPETSLETFSAPPANTFKKKGAQAIVTYDNDPENRMMYTVWKELYYQDDEEMWHKGESTVNHEGIYYVDNTGRTVYYQRFAQDAERFSKSGQWNVQYENQVFSAPVTSSSRQLRTPRGQGPEERQDSTGAQTHSPAAGPRQPAAPASRRPPVRPSLRGSRGSLSSAERGPRRGRRGPRAGRQTSTSDGSSRSRSRSRSRTRSRSRSRGPESGGQAPVSPEEVGTRTRTPETRPTSRIAQLIEDARDPPVLLLQGPANSLKCFRRRSKTQHPSLFLCMSTSWSWVCRTSTQKLGNRMLVAFSDASQRTAFLSRVKLPRGVTWTTGSLNGL